MGIIDCVAIADTGSTDRTIELIEGFVKEHGLLGGVARHKWKDFGTNRTEALRFAEETVSHLGGTWYFVFSDADDRIVAYDAPKGKEDTTILTVDKTKLDKMHYNIDMKCGTLTYDRSWMVKYDPNRPWKWFHSLHEYFRYAR